MKLINKINIVLILTLSQFSFAQVGINNLNPQATLDINGNTRVSKTELKNTDPNYINVLVVDKDGFVDYHDKQNIIDNVYESSVETKKHYISRTPDTSKQVPCGKFLMRFAEASSNNTTINPVPQIKLNSTTQGLTQNVFYTILSKKNSSSNGFASASKLETNKSISVKSSDFTNLAISNSSYSLNELIEVYLSHPGDEDFYRLTFIARTMQQLSSNEETYSYTLLCEKF